MKFSIIIIIIHCQISKSKLVHNIILIYIFIFLRALGSVSGASEEFQTRRKQKEFQFTSILSLQNDRSQETFKE